MSTAPSYHCPRPLQLTLLGGFELRCANGQPICLHNKAMLLVALLALSGGGRTVSRERLISLLWSDRGEPQARASLRQALWSLRGVFRHAAPEALRVEGDMVALDASATAVDVERFERLVAEGSTAALEEAATLYRGDLLDGVRMRDRACEAHLLAEQARLRDLALSALDRLLNSYTAGTPPERVVATAHHLLALDSLNEPARRALMLLWAQQGRYDLALKQYEACRAVLRRELDSAPEPETERLAEAIRCRQVGPQAVSVPSFSLPAAPYQPLTRRIAALAAAALALAVVGSMFATSLPGNSDKESLATAENRLPIVSVVAMAGADSDARLTRTAAMLGEEFAAGLSHVAHVHLVDGTVGTSGTTQAARYLVRTTADGADDGIKLRVGLIDGHSAQPIWSERYNVGSHRSEESYGRPLSDTVTALLTHVTAEQETSTAQAAAAFVHGWHHFGRHDLEADRIALAAFSDAIKLEPGYGRAHAALAALYWRCWLNRCGKGRHLGLSSWSAAWDRAETHLRHAMKSPTPLAYQIMARMLMEQGRHAEALFEAERALSLDAADADSFATLAEIRTVAGAPYEALTELERVQGTKLADSPLYAHALGRTLFATGRFAEAAVALERAVALRPDDKAALELLTAAYGHLGRAHDAATTAAALTDLMRRNWRNPGLNYRMQVAEFDSATQLPGDRSLLLDGLRLAGIPN
jgi:DNA-binding SARP family transcriptional activator/TolB-like protein